MNEATTQPTWIRRYVPLAVAVLFGAALAVFAGLSARGDDEPVSSGYEAPEAAADRASLVDDAVTDLTIPSHPPLQLAAVTDDPPSIEVDGPSVDLRVLVLVHGANPDTNAVDQLRLTLDVIGIDYDVFDIDADELDESALRDGDRGFYNGIMLADAELRNERGETGLGRRQWQLIDAYARDFDVRVAVLSGFPGEEDGRYDYGMAGADTVEGVTGEWTGAGADVFASVATDRPIQLSGPAFASIVRADGTGPDVEPLLVDQASGQPLISLLRYDDGREVLLSSITMGEAHQHSYALVYDFIAFATSGLHIGAPRTHLAVHIDDLFLDYVTWDADANAASGSAVRNTAADIDGIVAAQRRLVAEHDTLSSFAVDFPFNGVGADVPDADGSVDDALTEAVLRQRERLRFLNHTYEHRDLDVSAGAGFRRRSRRPVAQPGDVGAARPAGGVGERLGGGHRRAFGGLGRSARR